MKQFLSSRVVLGRAFLRAGLPLLALVLCICGVAFSQGMPAPGVPAVPRFGAASGTSLVVLTPTLPANAYSFTLQRKLQGEADTAYVNAATGLTPSASSTVSSLAANTAYTMRLVATGMMGGSTPGAGADITTAPAGPAAPTFSSITATTVNVTAPALTAGATSLTLIRQGSSGGGMPGMGGNATMTIATGLAAASVTTVSGLTPTTAFTFAFVAVNANGSSMGTTANVTTAARPPETPGIPAYVAIAATTVDIRIVALPAGATGLKLQRKAAAAADTAYADVTTVSPGSVYSATGLTAATAYTFRFVATASAVSVPGAGVNVTTAPAAPGTPGLPVLSAATQTSLIATAPALPAGATSLTLQRVTGGGPPLYMGGAIIDLQTGLAGGAAYTVTGLTSNNSYSFRYTAVGPGGSTVGSSASLSTLPVAPDAPAAPSFASIAATTLSVLTPPLPQNATSFTLSRKLASASDTTYVNTSTSGSTSVAVTGLTAATAYTFRLTATGTGGSAVGPTANVTTLAAAPSAPGLPVLSAATTTTITSTAPALPAGATSLTLIRRIGSFPMGTPVDVAGGLAAGAVTVITDLTPGVTYTVRYAAIGAGGRTEGSDATLTTLFPAPGAPGAPAVGTVAATSITFQTPPLTPYATSFKLQRKAFGALDGTYVDAQTGLSGNTTATASTLTAATAYTFRLVAIGTGASTPGDAIDVTSAPVTPTAPGAPTFSSVAQTTLTATAPGTLPANTVSLTLQRKLTSQNDSAYVTVATGLAGGAATNVTDLAPGVSHTFRLIAVNGSATTIGTAASVSTLSLGGGAPAAPDAPVISLITSTTLSATAPALPPSTTSLTLQKKLQADDDSLYANVATGIWAGMTTGVTGLTTGTAYSFRYLAVNGGTSTPGAGVDATTLAAAPGTPGVPTFGTTTADSTVVIAPALPANAATLTLQRVWSGFPSTVYTDIATGLAAAANTTVSGLNANAAYTFRYVAVGAGGQTPGGTASKTTLPPAPAMPEAPVCTAVAATTLTITAPGLPTYATSLTLQKKLQADPDTSYANIASGSITGLTASTSYSFRFVAAGTGGTTNGPSTSVTTLAALPGAPLAPTYSSVTQTTVVVTAPALPAGTTSLTLQRVLGGAPPFGTSVPVDIQSGLAGGAATTVTDLTPASTISFRYLAVGPGGNTAGTAANVTLLPPAPVAPGAPVFSSISATTLSVTAPVLPQNATSFKLERKLTSDTGAPFTEVASGLAAGASTAITGLTAATTYSFRYIAIGSGGNATGPSADVTTLILAPGAPSSPTFRNVTTSGFSVLSVPLPVRTTSLTLQMRSAGIPMGGTWANVATGLQANSVIDLTNLTAEPTSFTLRFVAVGDGGTTTGAEATVITLNPAPLPPASPLFSDITANTVRVTAPAKPAYAFGLKLQRKVQGTADSTYGTIINEVPASGSVVCNGLTAGASYTFRFVAIGQGGSTAGASADVTTSATGPDAPDVPAFSAVTTTAATVTAPVLPARADSLTLQRKVSTADDSTYVLVAGELGAGAVTNVTGLDANIYYLFRYVAVNVVGQTPGPAASPRTIPPAPDAPGVPALSALTSYSVTVTMPTLPANAVNMKVQRKLSSQTDLGYVDASSALLGGATASVSLSDQTAYVLRIMAYGPGGQTAGAGVGLETPVAPPWGGGPGMPGGIGTPAVPTFSNIGTTTLTVTLPEMPLKAATMTLQRKLASAADTAYANQTGGVGLGEFAEVNVTGLTMATAYSFRVVASNAGATSTTTGYGANVTMAGTADVPGAPIFSAIRMNGVTVGSTAIANNAAARTLSLQMKITGQDDDSYVEVGNQYIAGTGVVGTTAVVPKVVDNLSPKTSYTFRYVLLPGGMGMPGMGFTGPGGTPGPTGAVTTLTPLTSWDAGTAINCAGIQWPEPNLTIKVGAIGHLSSFLATDWDNRTLSAAGVSVTKAFSDTCTYTWSADGGSFENGNTGQAADWTAPTEEGTYHLTLVVDDQGAAAQGTGDGGSRDDALRGFNDDPLRFSVTVIVIPE